MKQRTHCLIQIAVVALLALAGAGCGGAAEPAAEALPGDPIAPAGVVQARDAVLDFLRQGANECIPPQQAGWSTTAEAQPPAGFDVYRFASTGCLMTITVAEDVDEAAAVYHVALGDGPTGFCWQAVVGPNGRILLTGSDAQTDPTLGNPAAAYCQERGYTFEVVTLPVGGLCGVCIFEDGRQCNAWAYFHGVCTPDNAPTPAPTAVATPAVGP